MATDRGALKKYFEPFAQPKAYQFAELIDAFIHKENDGLHLDESGNLRIGRNNPSARLQFPNQSSNRKIVLWESADNEAEYYGFGINHQVLRYQVSNRDASHVFFAADGSEADDIKELMRIKGNGKVGIGITNPEETLSVFQSLAIRNRQSLSTTLMLENRYQYTGGTVGISVSGYNYWHIRSGESDQLTGNNFSKNNNLHFYSSLKSTQPIWDETTPEKIFSFARNGHAYSKKPGEFLSISSDRRVKENVENFTKGLEIVRFLQPVNFTFNGKGGTINNGEKELGFIAQDVQSVFSDMIISDFRMLEAADKSPTELFNIDTAPLKYLLVNAIKELDDRLRKLENGPS